MVYYGAISKGCQGCRLRKIKCDERKPGCLRCEKAKRKCPGFRNLVNIMFRDESERIIRKTSMLNDETQIQRVSTSRSPNNVPYPLSQPINEIGARFFFAKYTCNEPPFSEAYISWLTQLYYADRPNHALQAAIEATGMAGISNIYYAPEVSSKSKQQYVRALSFTKRALSDPMESVADKTLLTVSLLGLFEFITMDNGDHYRSWSAHIGGAAALLQLRGQEQFNHKLGEQLFRQLQSQMLYICVLQNVAIPGVFLQLRRNFIASTKGKNHQKTQLGPNGDALFQLLDLRSAIKRGDLTDPRAICQAAIKADQDLESWTTTIEVDFRYSTIDVDDAPTGTVFKGKCHIYNNPWTAQAWNNWRAMRILANQIIVQTKISPRTLDYPNSSSPYCLIHELSTDICISAPTFIGTPRSIGFIWPLLLVAQEQLNPYDERHWAATQLRHISSTMGIQQAGVLANTILKSLNRS